MNQTRKNEILDTMVQIGKQVDNHLETDTQERGNIAYYQDFKFNEDETEGKYNLGVQNVYIVETPLKKERKIGDNTENNITIYEIYDEDKNLIATVTEDGKLHFTPEYLEKLKEINPEYFEQLNLENLDFRLPEELQENDIVMTKEELTEHQEKRGLNKNKERKETKGQKIGEKQENKEEQDKEEEKKEQAAEALGIEASEIRSICTINPREKITDKYNLIDIMPEAEGYDEVSIVCSSPNDKSQGRFTMLGVSNGQTSKKGKEKTTTCTPLTSIEPIEGTSTGKDIISVNEDGTKVSEKQVQGLFRINSRGRNDGISVSIGSYGMMDVDYVSNVMDKEHRRATPIRTKGPSNVRMPSSEVREQAGDSIDELEEESRKFREKEKDGIKSQSMDGIDIDRSDGGEMTLEELKEQITEKTLKQGDMSKIETREFIEAELEKSGLELSDGEIEHTTDEIETRVIDESRFESREYR